MTAPRELAEAVARLRALFAGTGWGPSRDDFALVEAALAEAQRERDALQHRFDQFTDPELLRIEALGDTIDKLAAAQAEAAKLREALAAIVEDLTHEDHRPGDWSEQVVIKHARAALAAPPSTAATPEGK